MRQVDDKKGHSVEVAFLLLKQDLYFIASH